PPPPPRLLLPWYSRSVALRADPESTARGPATGAASCDIGHSWVDRSRSESTRVRRRSAIRRVRNQFLEMASRTLPPARSLLQKPCRETRAVRASDAALQRSELRAGSCSSRTASGASPG